MKVIVKMGRVIVWIFNSSGSTGNVMKLATHLATRKALSLVLEDLNGKYNQL